ncbi:9853_t:CDS:2, partial [Racocetra fulgida]
MITDIIFDKKLPKGKIADIDSVLMGHTSLSKEDVKSVIDGLAKEWSGN